MDRVSDIVSFVRGERRPLKRFELLLEISKLSMYCGSWPKGSFVEWGAALNAAIAAGRLVESDGKVRFPVEVEPALAVQLSLF